MKVFKTMDKLTPAGRLKTTVGGLLFTALSLVFVVAGIVMVVRSAHQAATYLPAAATIDKVTGGDAAADEASIAWSFSVGGTGYTGKESADEDKKREFNELRQCKVGQRITVHYDPGDPTRSQRSVKADAMGLGFTIFVLPFLLLALNQLWLGLTGKEMIRSRQPNAQSDAVPGGGMFWVFVLTCAAGAFGHFILSFWLQWPWSLVSGLTILFVAIPGLNLWANRLAKGWRSAKLGKMRGAHRARRAALAATAHKRPGADANEVLDAEASLPALDGLGKKLAIALAFTIFWCAGTGLFSYFTIGPLVRHHYAKLRFAATDGVVLSSTVKVSSGSEGGSTFAARIKYRYPVAGREYVGDRYDFLGGSSSDGSYARRAVSENPPGKAVTVYYDPADPSEAVLRLEAPGISYFFLLFLQPFLLAGLVLIGWTATVPFAQRRLTQFFRCDASTPWDIPGWGAMEQDVDGLVIQRRQSLLTPLGHFLVGYGVACFGSTFVVALFFHGFGDADVGAIRWAFLVAAGVGVAALLRKLLWAGQSSRVVIDTARKRLAIYSRRREMEAPFDKLKGLRLRQIMYQGGMAVNGERVRYLLLEAGIDGGDPMPLHAFKWQPGRQAEILALAERAQCLLARLIGCPAVETVADAKPEESDRPSNPIQAISQLTRLFGGRRSDSYGDLT
jgi:hypothetical protein